MKYQDAVDHYVALEAADADRATHYARVAAEQREQAARSDPAWAAYHRAEALVYDASARAEAETARSHRLAREALATMPPSLRDASYPD